MTKLVMGKNPKIREIKIRNLTRILVDLEEGTTSCEDYFGEEGREWKSNERELLIREMRDDIETLKGVDA